MSRRQFIKLLGSVVVWPSGALATPLFTLQPLADDEPPSEQPCINQRGRVEERPDGLFLHFCAECDAWGVYGYDVNLRAGRLGRWYCREHRPAG
jgi:hypothetical protein